MKLQAKNPYIKQALQVLAPLGLDNEVHPDKIRLNDAANYLARILDEEIEDPPVAEVLEHLGVPDTNTAFKAAVEAALKAPQPDAKIAERLKIEAAVKADSSLTKQYASQLKKWAIDDIDEAAGE